jgi:hypothetical protein
MTTLYIAFYIFVKMAGLERKSGDSERKFGIGLASTNIAGQMQAICLL